MLMVQPPVELLLADREGLIVVMRTTLPLQRETEPGHRRERLPQHLIDQIGGIGIGVAERIGHLMQQLRTGPGELHRRIQKDLRRLGDRRPGAAEEIRCRAQATEQGAGPVRRCGMGPAEDGVEGIVQVGQPETGIVHVRAFPLEAGDRDADLIEEGGPVDLLLLVVDVERLDRHRHRFVGHEVLAHPLRRKVAQPLVVCGEPRRAPRGGVEVPAKIEVGPVEVGGGGHRFRSGGPEPGAVAGQTPVGPSLRDDL